MLQLTYNEIYSAFYAKVEAYDLAGMVEQQAYDMLAEWLHSVVSNPRVVRLISEFAMDDEIRLLQFTLKRQSGMDEIDRSYMKDIFATGVALRWVEPKYYSALNTAQVFGSSEIRLRV